MIKLNNISKSFIEGKQVKHILKNACLDLTNNKSLIILGSSGSGKTTLLNIVSGIDIVDSGHITIFETDISSLDDNARADFRKNNIGFVFQFYNLIPTLTVKENILLPLELINDNSAESKQRAMSLLEEVNLIDRLDSYPDTLSGGEQQRVSLVRSLVHKPKLLIADEPTGNLDKDNSAKVIQLIRRMCKESDVQLIMATHNQSLIEKDDLVMRIENQALEVVSDFIKV